MYMYNSSLSSIFPSITRTTTNTLHSNKKSGKDIIASKLININTHVNLTSNN